MIIRSAKEQDRETIKILWKSCFGDPDLYIDFFLNNRFSPKHTALLDLDGDVIGMVHLLPCKVFPAQKALYWYAAGIREDMRGRGLFRILVTEVLRQTQTLGFANVCVPAPGLAEIYRKFGFSFTYAATEHMFIKDKSERCEDSLTISEAEPLDFIATEPGKGDTVWELSSIEYAFKENSFCGGKQLKFYLGGRKFCFFAIPKEGYFLLDYHHIGSEIASKIKGSLFMALDCNKIVLRCANGDKVVGLADSALVDDLSRITMTLG